MLQSEPLLVREGACENSSTVTATLVLSTIVAACISFGVGCVIGYKSPTQSEIMEDLSLSIAEAIQNAGYAYHFSYVGAFVSGKTADLLGRKGTMWVLNIFYIVGWLAIAFAKVSSAGLCVGSFLTGMSFLLQDHPLWSEGTPILALISIWVHMGSVGMEGIPWIIVAEINLLSLLTFSPFTNPSYVAPTLNFSRNILVSGQGLSP
ncbi:hypothetical protein V6Z11_A11G300100 [Gossypium hirsutum]